MKTQDKILETALQLFNERGVSQVSSRIISQELGISYGNLTYHFPKKKDIILALYTSMQQEMEQTLIIIFQRLFEADFKKDTLRLIFQITLKYKFIYLNMVELVRQYEEIRQTELLFYESRHRIVRNLMQDLIREGLLHPAGAFSYDLMAESLDITFQFWLISAEIFYEGQQEAKIDHYITLIYNSLIPHLTIEGKAKFDKFTAGM